MNEAGTWLSLDDWNEGRESEAEEIPLLFGI